MPSSPAPASLAPALGAAACLPPSLACYARPPHFPPPSAALPLPTTSAHPPAVSPACTRSASAVSQPHAAALRRPLALQPAHSPCRLIVVPPCSCSALSFLCLLYCSLPAPPFLHRRLSAPFFYTPPFHHPPCSVSLFLPHRQELFWPLSCSVLYQAKEGYPGGAVAPCTSFPA